MSSRRLHKIKKFATKWNTSSEAPFIAVVIILYPIPDHPSTKPRECGVVDDHRVVDDDGGGVCTFTELPLPLLLPLLLPAMLSLAIEEVVELETHRQVLSTWRAYSKYGSASFSPME